MHLNLSTSTQVIFTEIQICTDLKNKQQNSKPNTSPHPTLIQTTTATQNQPYITEQANTHDWTSNHSHLIQLNYLPGIELNLQFSILYHSWMNHIWIKTIICTIIVSISWNKKGQLALNALLFETAESCTLSLNARAPLSLEKHQKHNNFHTSWEKEGLTKSLFYSLVPKKKKIWSQGFMKCVQWNIHALL